MKILRANMHFKRELFRWESLDLDPRDTFNTQIA